MINQWVEQPKIWEKFYFTFVSRGNFFQFDFFHLLFKFKKSLLLKEKREEKTKIGKKKERKKERKIDRKKAKKKGPW